MTSHKYTIHTENDPSKRQQEGYVAFDVNITDRTVSIYTRQTFLNTKTGTLFYQTTNQLSFTKTSSSPDSYPVMRVYEKTANGSLLNKGYDTLVWNPQSSLGSRFGQEIGTTIEEEINRIYGEYQGDTNPNFFSLCSKLFPLLRHEKDFRSEETDRINLNKILHRTYAYNRHLHDALFSTSLEDAVNKIFKASWISTEEDFNEVRNLNSLWAIGHWDLGVSATKFKEDVPNWEFLMKLSARSFQIVDLAVKNLPELERLRFVKDVCDRWSVLKRKRGYVKAEINLRRLTREERKRFASEVAQFMQRDLEQPEFELKDFFCNWYSEVVLNRLAESTSKSFLEVEKVRKEDFSDISWEVKQVEDSGLVWVPSGLGTSDAGSLFERDVYYNCRPFNVLPVEGSWDEFVIKGKVFVAFNGYVVPSADLLTVLTRMRAEADATLAGLNVDVSPENRKLFLELSPGYRSQKSVWKLIRWGVVDPKRVEWLKVHKISSKKEVELFNSLPDMMFYDIISQDDE